MKYLISILFFLLFYTTWNTSGQLSSVSLRYDINLAYRVLTDVDQGVSEDFAKFRKIRRKFERPSITQGIGISTEFDLSDRLTFNTGLSFIQMGDKQKHNIIYYNDQGDLVGVDDGWVRHVYSYFTVPLGIEIDLFEINDLRIGCGTQFLFSYLLGTKDKVKKYDNVFNNPSGYPYFFTEVRSFNFGISPYLTASRTIGNNYVTFLNLGYAQHITYDFIREASTKQHNFNISLSLGLRRTF